MAREKQVVLWVMLGCVSGALILFFIYHRPRVVQKARTTPRLVENETLSENPAVGEVLGPQSHGTAPPVVSRARLTTIEAAIVPTARPQCSRDDECRGPKQAECTEVKCLQGQCIYDETHCECLGAEDCDDGDPCTRNHCFSSTKKCIYIPIDECK